MNWLKTLHASNNEYETNIDTIVWLSVHKLWNSIIAGLESAVLFIALCSVSFSLPLMEVFFFFWLDWLIGLIFHLTEGILSFTWYAISKNSFNNLSYTVLPLKSFHIWHWWLLSHLMKRLHGIKDGAEFTDLSLSKGRYFLFADIYWHSELMINKKKKEEES